MTGNHSIRAPRFHANLSRIKGRRLFTMPSPDWSRVNPDSDETVLLDVAITPLGSVAHEASFVAAIAQQVSSIGIGISIYRHDPEDDKPFNVDNYAVLTGIQSRDDFDEIVAAASTDADANLLDYLERNVFLYQLDKGTGHWRDEAELPAEVRVKFSARIP